MMLAIKTAVGIINSHQESGGRQSAGCLKLLVRQEDLEPRPREADTLFLQLLSEFATGARDH